MFYLAKNFDDYTGYQNDYKANSAKFLPNQIQKMNLSPQQQKILDLQNAQDIQSGKINQGQMDRVGKTLSSTFDPKLQAYNSGPNASSFKDVNFSGNPAMISDAKQRGVDYKGNPIIPGVNDFSAERQKVEDATYDRFDKRFAKDEESLRTRLANQGLTVGSDAWNAEFEAFNQAKNDARNQAILAGSGEQSRMFGLGLQARQQANSEDMDYTRTNNEANMNNANFRNNARQQANQEDIQTALSYNQNRQNNFNQNQQAAAFDNQMRGQQMQEALTRRQLPLQEYASLRSGQQIQNPNFQPFYQMNLQGGDIQGGLQNQYEQQMGQYNASVANRNNAKGGQNDLLKTGAMAGAMAFSDPILKENIRKVANIRGFNIYKYTMINTQKEEIGVMADEIAVLRPDCVGLSDDGFMMVDYAGLFGQPLQQAIN